MSNNRMTKHRHEVDAYDHELNTIHYKSPIIKRRILFSKKSLSLAVLLIILSVTWLSGCKDVSIASHPIATKVSQVQGKIAGDPFPEESVDAVLENHSFAALIEGAERGNSKAQYVVAYAYTFGIHVPKNFESGRKWALRAANQGVAPAQLLMGQYWQTMEAKREGPIFDLNISARQQKNFSIRIVSAHQCRSYSLYTISFN